ncbi:ABC transporter permease [Spirosoma sp. KNUC1025]|uniref:ABC transporter permease n=1 Tax=Spirosoma sp. KNUC1025 TaxID=2894082 RepID=UPI0038687C03|nr:ABC transporter permease [Spirosoma sp. KNUC1025]
MLTNYLKVALRNLMRHLSFSVINLVGLSVGLACCLSIYLFVQDEFRYDRFQVKADQIYRVVNQRTAEGKESQFAVTPPAYGPTLKANFPEVQQMVRLFALGNKPLVTYQNKKFFESDILLADSTFFDVFSFPLIRGNPKQALLGANTLVISESMARKYFGDQDPMNKQLTLGGAGSTPFRVTGVMKDVPRYSHLNVNAVGSFSTLRSLVEPGRLENWRWQQFYTYIVLPKGYNPEQLQAKLPALLTRYAKSELDKIGITYQTRLQPLTDIHLRSSELEYDNAQKGNIRYVYALMAIALFALLIACFNFMNLSTARSLTRAKEVGLRKAIGAERGQLIRQFLGESLLLTAMAMLVALIVTAIALPFFTDWVDKRLSLSELLQPQVLAGLILAVLVVGGLAGIYPAFFLSGFRPVQVLTGNGVPAPRQGAISLRKTLVVLQFTASTVLIIGTAVVFSQLRYIQQKDLGFADEQAIVLPLRTDAMREGYEAIKADLLRNSMIRAATACYGIPGGLFAGDGIKLPGKAEEISTNMFLVDPDYIPMMGMHIVAGRNFSSSYGTDLTEGFMLNESAVRSFGFGSPQQALGKEILWPKWVQSNPADTLKRGRVIGVVRDFNYKSLHQKIEPVVLHIFPAAFSSLVVRVQPTNLTATLDFLKAKWQAQAPDWPFEYQIVDQEFEKLYRSEQLFGKLFSLFTALSIFIAGLGLFGLATFMAQQRTKEIGVRKVLGASVASIAVLLSKDFLKLVLVAILIASPIAWYAMNNWLADFAYHIDIAWWMFAGAGLMAIGIALLTVSFQSIKAALVNPVRSLRSE